MSFYVHVPFGPSRGPFKGDPVELHMSIAGVQCTGFADGDFFTYAASKMPVGWTGKIEIEIQLAPPPFGTAASILHPHRTGDHYRDGEPQPGRFSHNGQPRSLLGRRFGPPTDEAAWTKRLAEIRAEREAG